MKKRLLSAALALAMVLTLLPVSAFAADKTITDATPSKKDGTITVTYLEAGQTWQGFKLENSGWYFTEGSGNTTTYHKVNAVAGVVVMSSNTNSGKYCSDISAAMGVSGSYYKLIGTPSWSSLNINKNITIDVFGANCTATGFSVSVPAQVDGKANPATSLTITDSTKTKATGKTSIGACAVTISKNGFTLNLSNVAATGDITGSFNTDCKVNLDNATVGKITLNGAPADNSTTCSGGTVSLTNGSTAGEVTITHAAANGTSSGGSITVDNSSLSGSAIIKHTSTSSSGGSITVKGGGSVAWNVKVLHNNGTGGSITLGESGADVTIGASSTSGQSVQLKSVSGGTITARNANVGKGVRLEGWGTNLTSVSSKLDAVRVQATTSNDPDVINKKAPTIDISGTYKNNVEAFNLAGVAGETLTAPFEVKISGSAVGGSVNMGNANVTVDSSTVGNGTIGVTIKSGKLTISGTGSLVKGPTTLGTNSTYGAGVSLKVEGTQHTMGDIKIVDGNLRSFDVDIPDDDTNTFGAVTDNASGRKYTGNGVKGGKFLGSVPEGWLDTTTTTKLYYELINAKDPANPVYTYYSPAQFDELISEYQRLGGTSDVSNSAFVRITGHTAVQVIKNNTIDLTGAYGCTCVSLYDDAGHEVITVLMDPAKSGSVVLPAKLDGETVQNWVIDTTHNCRYSGGTLTNATAQTSFGGGSTFGVAPVSGNVARHYALVANAKGLNVVDIRSVNVGNVNAGVTPKLDKTNHTITLTGAVASAVDNTIVLQLTLTGTTPYVVPVNVTYNAQANTAVFSATQDTLAFGNSKLTIDNNTTLRLPNGTTYTLKSDLSLMQGKLSIAGNGSNAGNDIGSKAGVVTRFQKGVISTEYRQNQLEAAMTGDGLIDFTVNYAVLDKFNDKIAEISKQSSSYANWIKQAKQWAWKELPANSAVKSPTEAQLNSTGYEDVWLVLYLDVEVSKYGPTGASSSAANGGFTAKLVPSWRVEVRSSNNTYVNGTNKDGKTIGYYVVNKGSLGKLEGDMGTMVGTDATVKGGSMICIAGTEIVIPTENNFGSSTKLGTQQHYAHQDGTYVSKVTVDNTSNNANVKFRLQHAAVNGDGFGTVVFNNTAPIVELASIASGDSKSVTKKVNSAEIGMYYDLLQPAVNDALSNDRIVVKNGYTGPKDITVTGEARDFEIYTEGNITLTCAASGVLREVVSKPDSTTGKTYQVQLLKDNIVKPEEPTGIPISVNGATGGTASVSKSRANEGDTITITLSPSSGYQSSGVTVRSTDGTTTTNISVSGSGNRFTFTVPKGSKGVTVTPAFVRVNTGVLITVSGGTYGTATTSAGSNRVAVGSTVSVTVEPRSGYRTMGLYVTADTGSTATPYRTGVNTFTFTVPNATSSVVVTPRFDVNNGTIFEDVWSTDYYSSPVSWAVRQGVTDGTDTYHFSPGQSCNRVQMVTFLWRAAGRPSTAGMANPFYDVSPSMGNDFYNAILWANAKGITNGDGSTTRFNPYKTVTRAEAVTFLWRYEGQPAASTNSGFYDVPAREWYAPAVTWAVGRGITNGDGSTTRFNPNGACLRAQIVTFLYRDITGARA